MQQILCVMYIKNVQIQSHAIFPWEQRDWKAEMISKAKGSSMIERRGPTFYHSLYVMVWMPVTSSLCVDFSKAIEMRIWRHICKNRELDDG